MVDISALGKVDELNTERMRTELALHYFDHGGRIDRFFIAPEDWIDRVPEGVRRDLPVDGRPVWVMAKDIPYPPQMTEAIKTALQTRLTTIDKELADLGVTGG